MIALTPDQQFARLVKFSMIGFVVVFAYFLLADLEIPLTPQAMATRTVVKIAPQVSGRIQTVNIRNNEAVEPGQLLFEIDPSPYQLALQQAKLSLEQALQTNAELDASVASAEAVVTARHAELGQKQREAQRLSQLAERDGVSRQLYEEAITDAESATAQLQSARAQLAQLVASRGQTGDDNLRLRQARNQVEQAELNLSYTRIYAAQAGHVSNLQLEPGSMVANGQPVMALVSDELDIITDFREKSLRRVRPGTQAWVAFDIAPGRLFSAEVTSQDAGVSAGQFSADGSLATPAVTNRWVRDAQRMRLHFQLQGDDYPALAAGSRATVQLLPENPVFRWLAHLQIRVISILHYIY